MDPISVTHLVQDRTQELQRVADQVRQERALSSTQPAEAVASSTPPAEARRSPVSSPTKAGGCAPAEPAV
jgi:hypothetical protein